MTYVSKKKRKRIKMKKDKLNIQSLKLFRKVKFQNYEKIEM